MRDRVFFPLAALFALGMIAAALIWPRGLGANYPSFAHPLTVPAPVAEAPPAPKPGAKSAPAASPQP
ncbi:MAG: hypothetical protein HY859_06445 [Caulobacterales bacterium]|nr:hypothetical protein [Caulobacterales bacterium]